MRNFYLIFMTVCFMGGMLLSAKAENIKLEDILNDVAERLDQQ